MSRNVRFALFALIFGLFTGTSPASDAWLESATHGNLSKTLVSAYYDGNPELYAELTPGDGTEVGNGRRRSARPVTMELERATALLSDRSKTNVMLALHPSMETAWVVIPVVENGDLSYAEFTGKPRVKTLIDAAKYGLKRTRILPSLSDLIED